MEVGDGICSTDPSVPTVRGLRDSTKRMHTGIVRESSDE